MSRLVLALPFTVIAEPDTLRLIAGEDLRYTFRQRDIDRWGAALVEALRAPRARVEALARVEPSVREAASALLARLIEERVVVVDAPAPPAATYRVSVEGAGPLAGVIRAALPSPPREGPALAVLAQDTMDYAAALAFGRAARARGDAWLWVSEGPLARGFVGPIHLPDGGPCFGCVLASFRRLSPAPALLDALLAHGERGGAMVPAALDPAARAILASLTALKIDRGPRAHAAAFALHVLEVASLEVSAHPLWVDPDCAEHEA
ncbi:MAG: TOMM precursor leader peptide-binding protein [Sandaracinaceae bacterium]|nr:TOMM precursor leader peptide-binding protein [Sandaracinaceae bacterium]